MKQTIPFILLVALVLGFASCKDKNNPETAATEFIDALNANDFDKAKLVSTAASYTLLDKIKEAGPTAGNLKVVSCTGDSLKATCTICCGANGENQELYMVKQGEDWKAEFRNIPNSVMQNQPDGLYALMSTSKGDILLSLTYDKTPLTVANFVGLAEGKIANNAKPAGTPYYDGLTFHRVIANFMIQGGDPQGNGMGGPGYSFKDEFDPSLKHDGPGVLSMANAGAGTNGSQFFITHVATPHLDNRHTVFGRVVVGQNVVNAIQQGDVIKSLTIVRKGDAASQFNGQQIFEQYLADKDKLEAERIAKEEAELAKYKDKAKTTPSGLMYISNNMGSGIAPAAGDTVYVHYDGFLLDGSKFDSSRDRGQPLPFVLGAGQVIPGWDEGIGLLKKGGKAKLIIPYQIAYGEMGYPPVIPPKATLVFDVELVDVKKR